MKSLLRGDFTLNAVRRCGKEHAALNKDKPLHQPRRALLAPPCVPSRSQAGGEDGTAPAQWLSVCAAGSGRIPAVGDGRQGARTVMAAAEVGLEGGSGVASLRPDAGMQRAELTPLLGAALRPGESWWEGSRAGVGRPWRLLSFPSLGVRFRARPRASPPDPLPRSAYFDFQRGRLWGRGWGRSGGRAGRLAHPWSLLPLRFRPGPPE